MKWSHEYALTRASWQLADKHNADIAALEAERDELRRRLDAVVALCPNGYVSAQAIRAIAEGRTE